VDGHPATGSALLRWDPAARSDPAPDRSSRSGTAVAVSYRIPIPRLRRLAQQTPAPAPQPVAG
jgi:hypothetical protein